jgi:hypothetical protein
VLNLKLSVHKKLENYSLRTVLSLLLLFFFFFLKNIPFETAYIVEIAFLYLNIHITLESKSVWNILCRIRNCMENILFETYVVETGINWTILRLIRISPKLIFMENHSHSLEMYLYYWVTVYGSDQIIFRPNTFLN